MKLRTGPIQETEKLLVVEDQRKPGRCWRRTVMTARAAEDELRKAGSTWTPRELGSSIFRNAPMNFVLPAGKYQAIRVVLGAGADRTGGVLPPVCHLSMAEKAVWRPPSPEQIAAWRAWEELKAAHGEEMQSFVKWLPVPVGDGRALGRSPFCIQEVGKS